MADTEEPQFSSLKDRIAALNKQKNFGGNGAPAPIPAAKPTPSPAPTTARRPPPPPPPGRTQSDLSVKSTSTVTTNGAQATNPAVPPRPNRSKAPPLPRRDTQSSISSQVTTEVPERPPLPSRTSTSNQSPALPARRPSGQANGYLSARRNSGSSEISQNSTVSSMSLGRTASSTTSQGSNGTMYKLPPVTDMSKLPALPPSRREREAIALEEAAKAAAEKEAAARERAEKVATSRQTARSAKSPKPQAAQPAQPGLPPRLPSRPARSNGNATTETRAQVEPEESAKPRAIPPRAPTQTKIMGFGNTKAPAVPTTSRRPASPPPVPVASRPTAAQIDAANARGTPGEEPQNDCWTCRDWSGPDTVSTQYPRESLPRKNPAAYLGQHLCSPFPSYTDKARAIFTWCHHNIAYDTYSFFNKCVKNVPAEESILRGLAVCGGYAEAYNAIARSAGLECQVVTGHGKGYGHTPLKKGERPPPADPSGHAWNAVRIDGGNWKLIDACWGAGHLCEASGGLFKQQFHPEQFTMTNDQFAESHFPSDSKQQFRDDGRIQGWDEYFIGPVEGEPPMVYGNAEEEGISKRSVEPREKDISVYSGQVIRFQFSKVCEHWTSEKDGKGKPPLLVLKIGGVDGRKEDMIPIETDGYWHWADVNARDLGAPGQSVQVLQVTSINNQDARGVTYREFASKKGRCAMAWAYVMKWDLV